MDIVPQDSDSPLKQCTTCSRKAGKPVLYPATTEYFHSDKYAKDKLCSSCKVCRTAKAKAWNDAHQTTRDAYNKSYYADHIEEERDRCALWASIPENKARKNAASLAWYERDIEHNREHARQYFQTERGKIASRAHSHNRRAQARKTGGKITKAQLQELYKRQKGKCYYCKTPISPGRIGWHADHVIPLSKGGSNDISNIVIACEPCNRKKHNKLPHEWDEHPHLF